VLSVSTVKPPAVVLAESTDIVLAESTDIVLAESTAIFVGGGGLFCSSPATFSGQL
jgi:hypothetical protein